MSDNITLTSVVARDTILIPQSSNVASINGIAIPGPRGLQGDQGVQGPQGEPGAIIIPDVIFGGFF